MKSAEQERAEFEAWARDGQWEVERDDILGATGYTDITLTVAWHAVQAARCAPAEPQPPEEPIPTQTTQLINSTYTVALVVL